MWNIRYDKNEHIYEIDKVTDRHNGHVNAKEERWGREILGVCN